MKPVLDATSGNRLIWKKGCRGKNRNIVFMDREYLLAVPPTIFADSRYLPFRENVFSLGIYDPPYHARGSKGWRFYNPDQTRTGLTDGKYPTVWAHYGFFSSKRELVNNLWRTARELNRVCPRIIFKWGTGTLSIEKAMALFVHEGWSVINRWTRKSRGFYKKGGTWWITFVRTAKPI